MFIRFERWWFYTNRIDVDSAQFAFVCSPFSDEIQNGICYAKECARIVMSMGYIPLVPGLYYSQIFNDDNETERQLVVNLACKDMLDKCSFVIVFEDNGISGDMQSYIDFAEQNEIPVRHAFVSG